MTETEYLLKRIAELEAELAASKPKKKEKKERQQSKGQATRALTEQEYLEFIDTMRRGFTGAQPNERVAKALTIEAATGMRISDVLQLKPSHIVAYDGEWHFNNLIEKKTGKPRKFVVQDYVAMDLKLYCSENGIQRNELIFPFTVRNVQIRVKNVADYLGLEGIGTHSFRKLFAKTIYKDTGYNSELVRKLLLHSRLSVTEAYIGHSDREANEALKRHVIRL